MVVFQCICPKSDFLQISYHKESPAFINWFTFKPVYLYTCTHADSTPQVHSCISSMTGVTSRPGTLLPGNTGGKEETIRGRYSCR